MYWALLAAVILGLVVFLAFQDPSKRWPESVMEMHRTLAELEQAVQHSRWSEADLLLERVVSQWEYAEWIFFFNSESVEMADFSRQLARLEGAVESRDTPAAQMEFLDLYDIWLNLISW